MQELKLLLTDDDGPHMHEPEPVTPLVPACWGCARSTIKLTRSDLGLLLCVKCAGDLDE